MSLRSGAVRLWAATLSLPVLVLGLPLSVRAHQQVDKSANVRVVERVEYDGGAATAAYAGSDLDFRGRFVYAAQLDRGGGVHIFDVSNGATNKVGMVRCPGYQNDVAVVRPGLIALGYHDSPCSRARAGIQLFDVRDPARPRVLGAVAIEGGTHTLTVYPGKPLIYSSPGGAIGPETIVDVSDPRAPRVVAEFAPDPDVGCHDIAFQMRASRKLGFCAGENATQIWDVSDPVAPEVLAEMVNPAIRFHHSAVVTPDGDYLVIGDEGSGVCAAASLPTGALWTYDIRDAANPVLVGYYGVRRDRATVCTAHNFNFIPNTRYLVTSWFIRWDERDRPARPVEPGRGCPLPGRANELLVGLLVSGPHLRQRHPGSRRVRGRRAPLTFEVGARPPSQQIRPMRPGDRSRTAWVHVGARGERRLVTGSVLLPVVFDFDRTGSRCARHLAKGLPSIVSRTLLWEWVRGMSSDTA